MNYPEPTVSGIVINKENKILLCKSHKWNDQYVIPGGHIEYGEKMEDALYREVFEETGLKIYDVKLLGVQEFIYSKSFIGKKHFISFDFLCRTMDDKVMINDEAEGYIWVERKDVLNYDLGGYLRQLFTEYLKKSASEKYLPILYNYVKTDKQSQHS